MRFVVFGAGAIGGLVGGRLAQSGHDVVLVARGPHAAAMRAGGVRIEDPDGSAVVDVPVVERVAEAALDARRDVALVCVKSQDTGVAHDELTAAAGPHLPVVCLQNGVDNERAALRRFRDVYAVPVMCPAQHLEPGVVEAASAPVSGILDVGRYPSGRDDRAEALAAAFRASTFVSEVRPDVMRWKWTKLLMNLGNAVDAACGSSEEALAVTAEARREGVAALRAAGVEFASRQEDLARRGDLISIRPVAGRSRGGGSSWQSLARRTGTIESDHLNGEIVLLGRLHGVPTPVNEVLQAVGAELARTGAPPGSLPVEELRRRIEAVGAARR